MSTPPLTSSGDRFLNALGNSYAALPSDFYTLTSPSATRSPKWILRNEPLARELGLDLTQFASQEALQTLAGNRIPKGATPIAQAYAGHQFGHFNPQLGDGRALLLGELQGTDGVPYDVQLKGSGVTAYSRNGDGRSAIGPVIREFIVSEAMHNLGVQTTRSLAAVASGDSVWRNGPVPGAVLTRIATSHVRVGTFEYFAARKLVGHCEELVHWVIGRHYPHLQQSTTPAKSLLLAVAERQADLIAHWMSIGFIHGVMNTDNCAVSGQTLDFGPCAFMDEYRFSKVFSSIDAGGRYAYGNQPHIGAWNTMCLGNALSPLLATDAETRMDVVQSAIDLFAQQYERSWNQRFCRKLGIREDPQPEDQQLIESLLAMLETGEVDFTIAFRTLTDTLENERNMPASFPQFQRLFPRQESTCQDWLDRWRQRLDSQASSCADIFITMSQSNPVRIPRNHHIERAIESAEQGDFSAAEKMHQAMQSPYEQRPEAAEFAEPPTVGERVQRTFCGT